MTATKSDFFFWWKKKIFFSSFLKYDKVNNDYYNNDKVEPLGGKDGLPALSTSGANVVHDKVNGFPNFLKMNVSRKKNIVEV